MNQPHSLRKRILSVMLLCMYCLFFTSCAPSRLFRGNVRQDILNSTPSPQAIESLIALDINNVKQWLLIRGHDRRNPVMLSVHGGPGFPNMWNIDIAGRLLEQDFTVVYWEQRGTMKSWDKKLDCTELTLLQLTEDIITVSEWLVKEFQQPQIYLRGESFGTVPALMATTKRPDLFCAFISNSQVVELLENETRSWQFADSCSRARGDRKAIKSLSKIDPKSPGYGARENKVLKSYVGKYGGWFYQQATRSRASALKSLQKMLKTPEYSIPDIWNTVNHPLFSSRCLESEIKQLNFFQQIPCIDVPVIFMNGRNDQMTPSCIAYRYFEYVVAPKGKYFIWFDNSAHSPMFEEPYRYYQEMLRIHKFLNPNQSKVIAEKSDRS